MFFLDVVDPYEPVQGMVIPILAVAAIVLVLVLIFKGKKK